MLLNDINKEEGRKGERARRRDENKREEIVRLDGIIMISTGAEKRFIMSLPSDMQNVLGNDRLNCLMHLLLMTEARIAMRPIRIRIHEIPDSKSSRIWAYLGDGDGDGVVGVFEMLMVSRLRLL